MVPKLAALFESEEVRGKLLIVENDRVRIRGEE